MGAIKSPNFGLTFAEILSHGLIENKSSLVQIMAWRQAII